MPTGVGLHIGLNGVDPRAYGGWEGTLEACVFDAQDLSHYAQTKGIATLELTDSAATVFNVVTEIQRAAERLEPGDLFVLTYSGHGGQIRDYREEDGFSETWVLWDRQLLDDELYHCFTEFKKGVRILVLSDSCHSGTVIRAFEPAGQDVVQVHGRSKLIPYGPSKANQLRVGDLYGNIQDDLRDRDLLEECEATAILISSCQDNQVSYDGERNGAFTGALREILAQSDKGMRMGYRGLRRRAVWELGAIQSPNFFTVGPRNRKFELQQPFTV